MSYVPDNPGPQDPYPRTGICPRCGKQMSPSGCMPCKNRRVTLIVLSVLSIPILTCGGCFTGAYVSGAGVSGVAFIACLLGGFAIGLGLLLWAILGKR